MLFRKIVWHIFFGCCLLWTASGYAANEWVKGIYITEGTMNNSATLKNLISKAKAAGINTFVVDYKIGGSNYAKNIKLVLQAGLKYVARIVVFPDGGTNAQVLSPDYWAKIYSYADRAIKLGASRIQLDYIRYKPSQRPSARNAQNIYQIIKWFKNKLDARGIPLEIDVFGVSAFGDSVYIGQSLTLFADSVDAVCPMLYPSHFEPYQKYAKMPYFAVHSSVNALRQQFYGNVPFKIYVYIETYNYRYRMSDSAKLDYIEKQIQAVEDSRADGFYVWNPFNKYDNLFTVLKNRRK